MTYLLIAAVGLLCSAVSADIACDMEQGHMFCMETGGCVDHEGNCVDALWDDDWYMYDDDDDDYEWYDDGHGVVHCEPGQSYCLESGMCVGEDGECIWPPRYYDDDEDRRHDDDEWDHEPAQCQDGYVYCLEAGRCVNREGECQCDRRNGCEELDERFGEEECISDGGIWCMNAGGEYDCTDSREDCLPEGQCPQFDPEMTMGTCEHACEDDGDCGGRWKCCTSPYGGCGPSCVPADTFGIDGPVMMCMKHEEASGTGWYEDMMRGGYRSLIDPERQLFRIELHAVENEEVLAYHYIDENGARQVWDPEAMLGFSANTDVIPVFERPYMAEFFPAEMRIFAEGHEDDFRSVDYYFVHLPSDPRPEITWHDNMPTVMVDEGDLAYVDFMDYLTVTDESAESIEGVLRGMDALTMMSEDALMHVFMDDNCLTEAIREQQRLVNRPSVPFLWFMPDPVPESIDDIMADFFVMERARKKRDVMDREERGRRLSDIGGAMHLDDILVISPRGHGVINLRIWALDGSPESREAVERAERMGQSGLNEILSWLETSEHSSGDTYPANVLNVEVVDINYSPEVDVENRIFDSPRSLARFLLPAVPYELDLASYQGFDISDLTQFFIDHDLDEEELSTHLGISVVRAQSGEGQWEYMLPGSSEWVPLNVDTDLDQLSPQNLRTLHRDYNRGQVDLGAESSSCTAATAKTLPPGTRLRYAPTDPEDIWMADDAGARHFAFIADDLSDVEDMESEAWPKLRDICVSSTYPLAFDELNANSGESPLSMGIICTLVQREGCRGEAGTGERPCELDDVQVEETGCDEGEGEESICGHCIGPNTDLTEADVRDCMGCLDADQLGQAQFVTHEVQDMGGETVSICCSAGVTVDQCVCRLSCDCQYDSGAFPNSCGVCVGGSTGLAETEGMDRCGVCGGRDECVDCGGHVDRHMVEDDCGTCQESRQADTWNQACEVNIQEFSQAAVWNGASTQIAASGRFDNVQFVGACFLQDAATDEPIQQVQVTAENVGRRTLAVFSTPVFDFIGYAELSCIVQRYDGEQMTVVSMSEIQFYGDVQIDEPAVDIIFYPDEGVELSIEGTGFTDDTMVYFMCPRQGSGLVIPECSRGRGVINKHGRQLIALERAEGTDTMLTVHVTPLEGVERGTEAEVLLFENLYRVSEAELEGTSARLPVRSLGRPPMLLGVRFSDDLCKLLFMFDMPVVAVQQQYNCAHIFAQTTLDMLGEGAECGFRGRHMGVMLGEGATVQPGDDILFAASAIQAVNAPDNQFFEEGNAPPSIEELTEEHWLDVWIRGPAEVGQCSVLHLAASVDGSLGCTGEIMYTWNIQFAETESPDEAAISALDSFLPTLQGAGSSIQVEYEQIPAGYAYVIEVSVENSFGLTSELAQHHVFVSSAQVDYVVSLVGPDMVDPSDRLTLVCDVDESGCAGDRDDLLVDYSAIGPTRIDMLQFSNRRRVNLRPEYFDIRGNSVYEFTCHVTVESNSGVEEYSASHRVHIASANPVAILNHERSISVRNDESFALDGSLSYDPDQAEEGMTFLWSCTRADVEEDEDDACYSSAADGTVVILGHTTMGNGPLVDGLLLEPGRYTFELDIVSGTRRSDTARVRVRVVNVQPPRASLSLRDTPHDNLAVAAQLCFYGSVEYEWQAVDFDSTGMEYDSYDVAAHCGVGRTEVSGEKSRRPFCAPVPLVCRGGFDYDSVYNFVLLMWPLGESGARLADEDGNELMFEASVVVETEGRPSIREFTVAPMTGVSYETEFFFNVLYSASYEVTVTYYDVDSSDGSETPISAGLSGSAFYSSLLGSGSRHFKVYVCKEDTDVCASRTSEEIAVEAASDLTPDDVNDMVDDTTGVDATMGLVRQLINDERTAADPEVRDAVDELRQQVAEEAAMATDPSVMDMWEIIERIMEIYEIFPPGTVISEQMADRLHALILALLEYDSRQAESDPTTSTRRKKRTAPEEGGDVGVTAMDVGEVLGALAAEEMVLSGLEDDDVTQQQSHDLFDDLYGFMRSLCANNLLNSYIDVVDSPLACMSAQYTTFDDIANQTVNAGLCETNNTGRSEMMLNEQIQEDYSLWNCSDSDECYGACIATLQMSRDLRSQSGFGVQMSPRRSNLVDVRLISPFDYAMIDVWNLTGSVMLEVEIIGEVNLTDHSLECRQWVNDDWTSEYCSSGMPVESADMTTVTCTCSRLALTSVFEDEPVVEEDAALDFMMTTEFNFMPNAEETTEDDNDMETETPELPDVMVREGTAWMAVEFRALNEYDAVVGSRLGAFLLELAPQLVQALGIQAQLRLRNLNARSGSIIISFEVGAGGEGQVSLSTALTVLRDAIIDGTLQLSVDGTQLVIQADSFRAQEVMDDDDDDTSKKKNNKGDLVLLVAVICAILLLVILVLVVVVLCALKKSKGKKNVSPNQSNANLYDDPKYKVERAPPKPALYTSPKLSRAPSPVNRSTMNTPIGGNNTDRSTLPDV